ncbi:MAG: PAS domain-containing protein [Crocinitomicaceae bacterium]|nr:PAS domain-containing protein [Crocinitomicaceae bacterium]
MKNPLQLMCADVYLNNIPQKDQRQFVYIAKPIGGNSHPLLAWGAYASHYVQTIENLRVTNDISALSTFANKFDWQNDLNELLFNDIYDGLVLTDMNLVIKWVNKGFSEMTGYSAKYAVGKTPRFLQGKSTSEKTRASIREKIASNKPFREVVSNYRKNSEEYECEIFACPLRSKSGEYTHYLALEKEVK